MDVFERSDEQYAKKDGLFIESRQLSWLVSVLLIFGFFIFWAGYFLGQKKVLTQFAHTIEHRLPVSQEQQTAHLDSPVTPVLPIQENYPTTTVTTESTGTLHTPVPAHFYEPINLIAPKEHYYAQLASFDSQEEAEQFVTSLKKWEITVSVKERHNVTSSGSRYVWYQVVTDLFEDKDELTVLVDSVAKQEKLRDICYVCC